MGRIHLGRALILTILERHLMPKIDVTQAKVLAMSENRVVSGLF
jgi:hypothetical protein